MARQIIDKVVQDSIFANAKEPNETIDLLSQTPMYVGTVKNTLGKVKLDGIGISLGATPVYKGVEDLYNQLGAEGQCLLKLISPDGSVKEIPVSSKALRLLKALAINQLNKNADYSLAVATLFSSLLRQLVMGAPEIKFDYVSEALTPMERYVNKEIGDFIIQTLQS